MELLRTKVENVKNPSASPPKHDQYAMKARTSTSQKEQILFWESKVKEMEIRAGFCCRERKKAKEAWHAELKKIKELTDEHTEEEAEHNRMVPFLSSFPVSHCWQGECTRRLVGMGFIAGEASPVLLLQGSR